MNEETGITMYDLITVWGTPPSIIMYDYDLVEH